MASSFDTPTDSLVDEQRRATPAWMLVFSLWKTVIRAQQESGPTANRPTSGLWIGRRYWDTDLAQPVWVQSVNPTVWATAGGGGGGAGTVTTLSVATSNGFAGTVATATTTPVITLKTSITGLLKGNGTAISAAAAATDYVAPTTTVNGHALSSNVTVTAADVGAPSGSGTSSGTNTGDQTITLTGDVTGSGSGSFAATIAAGAVTLVKQASLAANSIIGNNTGSSATPIALTTAQVKTLLALTATDVGLGSVTNNAQTQAAIVPNTAPAAGRILVGNAGGTAYAPVTMSGDATLDSTGALTSTGKRRLANVTLGSAGLSLASGTITACRFLEIHIYISGYAGSDTASLQFNAAAGTAYRYRWLTCAAAATVFTAGLLAASTDRIKVAAVNTTNSRRVVAFISNDSAVTEKLVKFESQFGTGSAATQDTLDIGQGAWVSGAATQITSVSLVSSSNMNAGTQMVIYGWN